MKLGDLVALYIAKREAIAVLQKEYDDKVAPFKRDMDRIEAKFLEMFDKLGSDNLAVRGVGTVYRSVRTSASVADREAFMNFVKQNDEFELLEVRAAKNNVEAYLERTQELPPGVNLSRQATVRFQRAAHTTPVAA